MWNLIQDWEHGLVTIGPYFEPIARSSALEFSRL